MEERQLAVILHADVVGSTELVQRHETLAHARIQDVFKRFSATISSYGGTTHELRGDALVAEFERASDAVSAALSFQSENAEFNAAHEDEIKPQLRIGISMGEVVVADNTVTGPGVVLAQRLEQIAEPGGVCLQGAAYETVPRRLPFEYESLGEQEVKGFGEPVRAFAATLKLDEAIPKPAVKTSTVETKAGKTEWTRIVAGVIALVVIFGTGLAWWQPWRPVEDPASVERMAFPLPDKPSIAVLPFTNMSNDPEQEYFVDGMTEDLITDISKLSGLFVIARNTVFTYKGKAVNVAHVAEELGVRYVLEGSVRRAGKQVRINAQLINATTGGHLWAERYDGRLQDIFSLQDQVTQKIVDALAVTLTSDETDALSAQGTNSVEAYDAFLLGLRYLNVRDEADTEAYISAREQFEEALRLDPEYTDATAALSLTYWHIAIFKGFHGPEGRMAIDLARQALSLADNAMAHRTLARNYIHLDQGHVSQVTGQPLENFDLAVAEIRKAAKLEPNNADIVAELAYYLAYAGEADESITLIKRARRLNPSFPAWYHRPSGIAYLIKRDYGSAIEELIEWHRSEKLPVSSALLLTAAYALAGDSAKANETLLNLRESLPSTKHYTVQSFSRRFPFKREEDRLLIEDGLRKAGVANRPE